MLENKKIELNISKQRSLKFFPREKWMLFDKKLNRLWRSSDLEKYMIWFSSQNIWLFYEIIHTKRFFSSSEKTGITSAWKIFSPENENIHTQVSYAFLNVNNCLYLSHSKSKLSENEKSDILGDSKGLGFIFQFSLYISKFPPKIECQNRFKQKKIVTLE